MLPREVVRGASSPRYLLWISLLLSAVTVAACGGEQLERQVDIEPFLELPESTPVGQPLELTYSWIPGPEFNPPSDDYHVWVHLIGPGGEILMH